MKITKSGKNWFTIKFERSEADQALAREWLGKGKSTRRTSGCPELLHASGDGSFDSSVNHSLRHRNHASRRGDLTTESE